MHDKSESISDAFLQRHRRRLEAFVVRARRIEEHSLLKDLPQFVRWASGKGRIDVGPEGGSFSVELPPEELFESLAARARPLLLKKDGIHFDKVFGSMNAFSRGDNPEQESIDHLRSSWREIEKPRAPIKMGVTPTLDRPEELFSSVEIADGWMYGDLVHADGEHIEKLTGLTINQRYLSAVLLYGHLALHAVALLKIVRAWQADGRLGLEAQVFTVRVSADVPLVLPVARFAIAPVGMPYEVIAAKLDSSQNENE